MKAHSRSSAPDLDELKVKKRFRLPLSLMGEPAGPTIQMAIAQMESPPAPAVREVCQFLERQN